jgi:hypothetical protein
MSKPTYSELLRDPRWQRRRLEIMQRAEFRCEQCADDSKTLNVHHRVYRKGALPWEYSDDELACLCETCHEAEHITRDAIRDAMATMGINQLEALLGFIQAQSFVLAWQPEISQGQAYPIENLSRARGFVRGISSFENESVLFRALMECSPLTIARATVLRNGLRVDLDKLEAIT